MKLALTILLSSWIFGMILANNVVRKSVIFEKIKDISVIQGKWTAVTTINLDPYYGILKSLQLELETVKTILTKSGRDESEIISHDTENGTIQIKQILRVYQMGQRFSAETANFKANRRYLEEEIREIKFMRRKNKRAIIPVVGKVLSFLFGTLDEADLSNIRANIRQLATDQQKIKHVLTNSMTFIKDNQQNIIENRRTINEIVSSLQESIAGQTMLEQEMYTMQRFNDLYIHFDRTVSGLTEIVSVTRNHLQQLRLRLNMLSLGHLSPTIIPPAGLKQLLSEITNELPSHFKLPYDPETDLWSYYKILPCTTLIGEEDLVIVMTIPLLDASKQFEMFKTHNLPVPNRRTNQSNLLARYDINMEAVAIDDVRSTFTTLNK